ncbi:hypothetical protein PoB_003232600 [Plakobranchus ocellatus]|uniref:Uncharacterized protein n=1 Tax=Plakobranchus ocellatus TaxID=259542 RepID=A0AAV4AGS1_9GAST|nr:hypothetical protein PoB_003232600 [Plakobranchus ocellatus]
MTHTNENFRGIDNETGAKAISMELRNTHIHEKLDGVDKKDACARKILWNQGNSDVRKGQWNRERYAYPRNHQRITITYVHENFGGIQNNRSAQQYLTHEHKKFNKDDAERQRRESRQKRWEHRVEIFGLNCTDA